MRNRPFVLACAVGLGLILGCEQGPTVQDVVTVTGVERLGFALSSSAYRPGTDTTWLGLGCSEIPSPLPVVSIDDSIVPPLVGSRHGGLSWALGKHLPGELVGWSIAWQGDTLMDTIRLPPRIDSVFCNGALLRRWWRVDDTVAAEEQFDLRWVTEGAPYYYAHVGYQLADSLIETVGRFDTVLTEQTLAVPVAREGSEIVRLRVAVAARLVPTAESYDTIHSRDAGSMHCYREIPEGPPYACAVTRAGVH